MTTATTEGRRLVLTVEGVDPFRVDPLPAARGRALTDLFLDGALGKLAAAEVAAIFIEAIGPTNYARVEGSYVDQFDADGAHIARFDTVGHVVGFVPQARDSGATYRYAARPAPEGAITGDAIRQEEGEALCLAAFYWQTIVGMEGVQMLLADDAGTTGGSLKALNLLLWKLGVSPSRTSPNSELENRIQRQVDSLDTSTRSGSGTLAKLPPTKRSGRPAAIDTTPRWKRRRRR